MWHVHDSLQVFLYRRLLPFWEWNSGMSSGNRGGATDGNLRRVEPPVARDGFGGKVGRRRIFMRKSVSVNTCLRGGLVLDEFLPLPCEGRTAQREDTVLVQSLLPCVLVDGAGAVRWLCWIEWAM